jgi:hypothetical protein
LKPKLGGLVAGLVLAAVLLFAVHTVTSTITLSRATAGERGAATYDYDATAAPTTKSTNASASAFHAYDRPAQHTQLGIATIPSRLAAEGVGGVIKGYTSHGLAQAMRRDAGRGAAPKAILDAVKSPISKTVQADGSTIYKGASATVIVNKDRRVITTWATNSSGVRGSP